MWTLLSLEVWHCGITVRAWESMRPDKHSARVRFKLEGSA